MQQYSFHEKKAKRRNHNKDQSPQSQQVQNSSIIKNKKKYLILKLQKYCKHQQIFDLTFTKTKKF